MACRVCKALGYDGAGHNARRCKHRLKIQAGTQGAKKTPSQAYAEIFKRLRVPPEDPLELMRWTQQALAKVFRETARGNGDKDLNQQLTAIARTMGGLSPKDVLYEAKDVITRERKTQLRKSRTSEPLSKPVSGSKPLR